MSEELSRDTLSRIAAVEQRVSSLESRAATAESRTTELEGKHDDYHERLRAVERTSDVVMTRIEAKLDAVLASDAKLAEEVRELRDWRNGLMGKVAGIVLAATVFMGLTFKAIDVWLASPAPGPRAERRAATGEAVGDWDQRPAQPPFPGATR